MEDGIFDVFFVIFGFLVINLPELVIGLRVTGFQLNGIQKLTESFFRQILLPIQLSQGFVSLERYRPSNDDQRKFRFIIGNVFSLFPLS